MEAFDGNLSFDIFDKEDGNKVLGECFAKVTRDGDLLPGQQITGC